MICKGIDGCMVVEKKRKLDDILWKFVWLARKLLGIMTSVCKIIYDDGVCKLG